MPIYSIQAPNGKIYDIEGPEDADPQTLFAFVQQQVEAEELKRRQKEFGPGVLGTLGRGFQRGLGQLGSTITDIIPAMAASTLGFDEYAQEQLAEAEEKSRAREAAAPTLFPSYKDVEGIGDVPRFVAEVFGEQIPNIGAALVPGLGVGATAGRVIATGAAKQLAERAAQRGLTGEAAEEFVRRGLTKVAPQIAKTTGIATDAGVFLGSYSLNAPEIFQNIYEETGELAPGAAAIFGAGAAALDSILPATLARQLSGPMKVSVVEKVLERSGMEKGLARAMAANAVGGVATEGLTEGAQESISIAAERFIDDNPEVFGSKEWDRIMNAAVKGAVGGGAFGTLGGAAEGLRERSAMRREEEARQLAEQQAAIEAEQQRQAAEVVGLEQAPDQMALPGMETPIATGLLRPPTEAGLLKPATPPTKLKEPKGVQQEMFTAEGTFTPALEKAATADEKKEAKKQEIIARQKAQREKAEAKEAQEKLKRLLAAKQMEFPGFDLETVKAQRAQEEAARKADEESGQGDLFRTPPQRPTPPSDTGLFDEVRGRAVQQDLPGIETPIASGLARPRTEADLLVPTSKPPKLKEPKGKQGEMFTAEGELTPAMRRAAPSTGPTLDTITKIEDPKAFGKLINVGPTALILRPDGPLAGKDISDPVQAVEVKQVLEAYASGKPATGAAEKIETFLRRPEFQGAPDVSGPITEPSGEGAGVAVGSESEPTTEPTEEFESTGLAAPRTVTREPDEGTTTALATVGSLDLRGLGLPAETEPTEAAPSRRLNMDFVAEARDEYNRTKRRREPEWNKLSEEKRGEWLDTYEKSGDALRPRYLPDESRTIEGEVREVPTTSAPPQITNDPSEVTTEAQADYEEVIHNSLTREEKRTLAQHYGQKTYNKKAKAALINDLVQAINEGVETVAEAIQSIVKRLLAAVLSAAMVFNANVFVQNDVIAAPAQVANMRADGYVLKAAPAEVAKNMSSAAQVAYAVMAPTMEQGAKGKLWTIFDKPNAYTFVFNPDGSLFYQGKTLTGKTPGDQLNDAGLTVDQMRDANKITPAGVFTLNLASDAEYAGGKIFQLKETRNYNKVADTTSYIAWHAAYTAGADGPARRKALAQLNPDNGRYSYGCLNANKADFLNKILPNASKLDGAPVFVVPDNQAAVMDFLQNTVKRTDYATPQAVQPLQRYVVDGLRNADSASAPAYTRALVGRAEQAIIDRKLGQPSAAATEKITNEQIASIVEDFGEMHYQKTGKRLFLPKFVGGSFDKRNADLAKNSDLNALITNMINQTEDPSLKKILTKIRSLNLKTKIVIGKPEGALGLTVDRRTALLKNPAFVEWFGNSKISETRTVFGKTVQVPTVMYHGTSRNIKRFQPKQAGAIFLSPSPDFSGDFARTSQRYMLQEALFDMSEAERVEYIKEAISVSNMPQESKNRFLALVESSSGSALDTLIRLPQGIRNKLMEVVPLPSYQNIIPVYARAENPFDFKNPTHISKIVNALPREVLDNLSYLDVYSKKDLTEKLKQGDWPLIESSEIQQTIRDLDFDSFYVYEGGEKNLAVYDSNQIKSAVNSKFNINDPRIRYAEDKAGSYDPATDTITLDPKNGMNAHAFVHELVHAAISNVLDKQDHPLTKEFQKFFISIRDRLGPAYGAQDLQEFAAELVSNPEFQALLKTIKTPRSNSLFSRIMSAITRFFGFAPGTNAFDKGLKFVSDAIDITGDVDAPAAQKMFLGMGNFPAVGQIGKAMPAATTRAIDSAKNLVSNLEGYGLKEMAFGLLRLDNLNQMYGDKLPAIQKLLDALELRNGKQERMIKDINEKYKRFTEIQKKHPQAMNKLQDVAIDARIHAVDLLNPNFVPTSANLAEYNRLKQIFSSLHADVQGLYRTIRNDYDQSFNAYQKILEDAAKKVSPSLAVQLAQQFQAQKPQVAYIPFLRQGKFWVEYTDPANNEPVVSSFQSIRERQQFIDQMLKPSNIQHRTYQNIEDLRFTGENLPPSSFIMQIMNGLRKKGATQAQLDGVYQAYLATFPAESLMKQFMKSKNRLGMEKDIVRGYGDLMIRWARKLSNAEYIPQIDAAVNEINFQAQQFGSDPTLTAVAQNITNQAAFFHNPNFSTFVHTATALSYFEYIAGNISSALINITSLPMLVWPILTGKYGWSEASKAMTDAGRIAMNDWKKNPRYAKLYDTLMDHAQLEHTLAREVLEGRRQTTSEFLSIKAKVMDGLSIPFTATEKYGRAVTAIAAYDLEFNRTKDQDKALRYALNTVKDVHTSGLAATGPRWMQTPLGRMFFTFKSFVWNSAYIMARAFHQAYKGETPEIRRAAQRQLLATYGMATVFAGVKGMPFYGATSVLATMINALFGDDEPFDYDEFMRSIFGEFFYKGAFNYATNLELANRAGIATDLIFRDDPRGIADHGYVLSALIQAIGPLGSIGINTERGIRLMSEGEAERGIEMIVPSFARNFMKGSRYLVEGATTIKGDPVMEDISAYNSLMQMIGFAPADLSSQYERVQAAKAFERDIRTERTRLLTLHDMAKRSGDTDLEDKVKDDIDSFNDRYPEKKITKETLRRSEAARRAAEQEMIAGVRFDKDLKPEIEDLFFEPYE